MIPIFHRCDYELHTAMKLKVKVLLSPHIYDSSVRGGYLNDDTCIANINIPIDSENALCSWEPDRKAIHAAIKSESSKGFDHINSSVEKIRLEYLLNYPVEKIESSCNEETDEEFEDGRYAIETYLVANITMMMNRVHSIPADEIPKFNDSHETQSGSSDVKDLFREWTEVVEFLINNKKSTKKKNDFISYFKNCCRGNDSSE